MGLCTNVCIDLVIFYLENPLLLVWRACTPMSVLTLWYFTWNTHYYSYDGLVHQCLYWPCDILPGISIITRLTGLCTTVCIDLVIFYLEYPLLLLWRACAPMSVLTLWYFTRNIYYYSYDGLVHQCLYWSCDILPGIPIITRLTGLYTNVCIDLVIFYQSIITRMTGLCTNVCTDLVIFYQEYLLLLVWRACAPMSVLILWYFTWNTHYYSSDGLVHQCLYWPCDILPIHYYSYDGLVHQCLYWPCDILPGISIITRLTGLCTNVCIDLVIFYLECPLLLVWRACAPMSVLTLWYFTRNIYYYSYDGLVHQCLYWPCNILPQISIITRLTGLCTNVCIDLVIFYQEYLLLLVWQACAPMSVLILWYFTWNIHYYSYDGLVHQCLYWPCDILPGISIITLLMGLCTNVCIDLAIFYPECPLLLVWRACTPMSVLTLWYFTRNIYYYPSDGLVHQCLYWPCDILPGMPIITRLTGLCTNVCIDLVIFYLEYLLLLVWLACAPMSVLTLCYFTWNIHYYSYDGLVHQCLHWPCDILSGISFITRPTGLYTNVCIDLVHILPGISIITLLTGLCTNVCIDLVIFCPECPLLLVWLACAPMSVLTLWYFTRNICYYSSDWLVHQCLYWPCDI